MTQGAAVTDLLRHAARGKQTAAVNAKEGGNAEETGIMTATAVRAPMNPVLNPALSQDRSLIRDAGVAITNRQPCGLAVDELL